MTQRVCCPACGSDQFFFNQLAWTKYTIESIEGGGIDTLEWKDEHPTGEYNLRCNECEWEGDAADYHKKVKERFKDDE